MAKKEQLNQNPDDANKQIREENSKSELKSENKPEVKQDQPVENQEQNSKKPISEKIAEEKETLAVITDKEPTEQPSDTKIPEGPVVKTKKNPAVQPVSRQP